MAVFDWRAFRSRRVSASQTSPFGLTGTQWRIWAPQPGSSPTIWLRSLDRSDPAVKLAGTEGALPGILWSHDSRFVAFVADGKLSQGCCSRSIPPRTFPQFR